MLTQHLVHLFDEMVPPANQLFLGLVLQVLNLLIHVSLILVDSLDLLLFENILVLASVVIARDKIAVHVIEIYLLTRILTYLSLDLLHMQFVLGLLLPFLEMVSGFLLNLCFYFLDHTVILLLSEDVFLQLLCFLLLQSQVPFKCLLVNSEILLIQ